jgi:integrase/recombinase XerD
VIELEIMQEQLRHSYASTTSLYTSVSSDFKQRVVQQMITRHIRMEDSGG